MFYVMTHSTHFIYGYMASDKWLKGLGLTVCSQCVVKSKSKSVIKSIIIILIIIIIIITIIIFFK